MFVNRFGDVVCLRDFILFLAFLRQKEHTTFLTQYSKEMKLCVYSIYHELLF